MMPAFDLKRAMQKVQFESVHQLRKERRYAYCGIVLLLCCVCVLGVAVTVLSDIHTVVPVVAVVDANGHVIKQQVVDAETITAEESVIQSEIYNFVTSCNTFDYAWRQHYADVCRIHSSQEVARQYLQEISQNNAYNPYFQLGKQARRYPKITGITFLEKNTYQVAFQLITEKAGEIVKTDYYKAYIRYKFTAKPLALGDRWENALGFAVTAYRKDQELSQ